MESDPTQGQLASDRNPMPEIHLFEVPPIIKKIGHFLFDHIQSEGLSEHFKESPEE